MSSVCKINLTWSRKYLYISFVSNVCCISASKTNNWARCTGLLYNRNEYSFWIFFHCTNCFRWIPIWLDKHDLVVWPETYSKPCQISKMERFAKSSILNVWLDSKYAPNDKKQHFSYLQIISLFVQLQNTVKCGQHYYP